MAGEGKARGKLILRTRMCLPGSEGGEVLRSMILFYLDFGGVGWMGLAALALRDAVDWGKGGRMGRRRGEMWDGWDE